MESDHLKLYRVSVVIPAFNAEKTIADVLDSIINQSYYKTIEEIIVVNDGSKDNTEKIVSDYIKKESKIKLINQENSGVSRSRNRGMEESRGNWIALCDSDDLWLENRLKREIEFLHQNQEIDFIGSAWNKKGVRIFGKKIISPYRIDIKKMCITVHPQTSTVLFRKEIFNEIGGYREDMRYAEDVNFFQKICVNYNCWYIPDILINFGGGKRGFGQSGLSGNLKAMHIGSLKNLSELKERKDISPAFYYFMRVFYQIKYFRRIIITKIER